jgi:hypothetical protein
MFDGYEQLTIRGEFEVIKEVVRERVTEVGAINL